MFKENIDITQLQSIVKNADDTMLSEKPFGLSKEGSGFLKEIHHRVKNNLQIISSLLKFQSKSIQDQKMIDIFTESRMRIQTMALVHEKLYRSTNLSVIDAEEYVTDLVKILFSAYSIERSKISFSMESDKIYFGIDTAIPFSLILNELLSNCFKHAFINRKKGAISVRLSQIDNIIHLLVADDGLGFKSKLEKPTQSLGLQIVEMFVEQLAGEIEFINSNGVRVECSFPNKQNK